MQPCEAGARLISLPRKLQLTYDASSDAALLALISKVPEELWGAKLALQVHHAKTFCSQRQLRLMLDNTDNAIPVRSLEFLAAHLMCGRQSAPCRPV